MALGTFTLTGTYTNLDGSPASGKVVIRSTSTPITDPSGNKVFTGPKTVILDTLGKFSIVLPTTGGGTLPETFGYRVTADLKHNELPAVEFEPGAAGTTVDMADVTPTVIVPVTPDAVTTASFPGLLEATDADPGSTFRQQQDARHLATYVQPRGKTTPGPAAPLPFFNVRDYGAVGDGVTDDSAAVQSWVDAVIAAKGVGYAPPGDYLLGSAVAKTVVGVKFALVGAGPGVTRFVVPASNTTGGILFDAAPTTADARSGQFSGQGFTIITQGVGAGTGLAYTMASGGNQHQRSLILHDVEIRGEDAATDCFDIGIDARGTWRPLLSNVIVQGPFGPGVSSNHADTSPLYVSTAALVLDDAYDWTVEKCYLWGAHTGLRDVGTDAEAGRIVDSVVAENRVGIDRYRTSPEPILWVDGCHVNNRDYNAKVDGAKLVVIRGCVPYNEDTAPDDFAGTMTDFWLDNVSRAVFAGNMFHFDGATDRIHIDVDTSTLGTDVVVTGNVFGSTAARAMRFGSAASSVLVTDNVYPGTYGKRIEDNSGTAVVLDHEGNGGMLMESFAGTASAGPVLTLRRDSATPAANDVLGAIRTYGRNAAAAFVQYALMDTQIVDPTSGSEDAAFRMWAMANGAITRIANFQAPAGAGDTTGMFLLARVGGVDTFKRVEVGAADSGGVGYRTLRVTN